MPICVLSDCFWQRPYGPQSLKYSLALFQKRFANPWLKSSITGCLWPLLCIISMTQADWAAAIWSVAGCHGAEKAWRVSHQLKAPAWKPHSWLPLATHWPELVAWPYPTISGGSIFLLYFWKAESWECLVKNIGHHRFQRQKSFKFWILLFSIKGIGET